MPAQLRELADQATDFRGVEEADDFHWIWGHVPSARLSPEEQATEDITFAWSDGSIRRQAVSPKIFKIYTHGGGQQSVHVTDMGGPTQFGTIGAPSSSWSEAEETQAGNSVIETIREHCSDNPPSWIGDSVTTWWPSAPDRDNRVEMKAYRVTGVPELGG
jgi:hypothetical protein